MRSRQSTTPKLIRGSLFLLVPLLAGCGTRGAPLPPVYPNPPAIAGLTVAQRGSFGILRFPPPAINLRVGSEDVELESVEVLVYAERYPVLTAEIIIAAIARRAEVMRTDAVAETAAARARTVAEAAAEEAVAAGREPPPPDPDAPPTTVRRRTPDEDAIYRMPLEVLEEWRRQDLPGDAILVAAQGVATAVDEVVRRLGLPTTVLDPTQPLPLPDVGDIAVASEEAVEEARYERPLDLGPFLARAAVSRRIEVDQFDELLVDELLQVAIPVGAPSTGALRTRYFFAVRGKSTRQTPGVVNTTVALAPAPVPVTPDSVTVTVGADGVELSWAVPAGDLALRRLDPDALRYNVYRMLPDEIAGPAPLNPVPLDEATYTDGTMQWGETYVYEVRALLAAAGTAVRESEGVKTAALQAVDVYPPAPPTNVVPTRAGSRVTLQWAPSATLDIIGYRVYRHPFPAPAVPQRFDPSAEEDEAAATIPPPAATPQEGNDMVDAGWELITTDPAPFSRFTDTTADSSIRYVYAVEAIDAAGNVSALALGTQPGDYDR